MLVAFEGVFERGREIKIKLSALAFDTFIMEVLRLTLSCCLLQHSITLFEFQPNVMLDNAKFSMELEVVGFHRTFANTTHEMGPKGDIIVRVIGRVGLYSICY